MKKIYTLILAIALSTCSAIAQITISTADLPHANDTFRVSTGIAFTGMDPSLTGTNYNWDYSQLTSLNQQVDTFLSVSNTNPLFSVVFYDLSINPNRCNVATPGPSYSLGTMISVTDVYNFFYNSSTEYTQKGLGASINTAPLPKVFSPFDIVYRLPLNYNDIDSSASFYDVDLTSTLGVYYSVNKMRHNLVDGWGTLTTPFGTFDALRMKSTILESDSVYYNIVGGFRLPTTTTIEYKWLAIGQGIPILQINTNGTGVVSQIRYRDSLLTTGIDNSHVIFQGVQVYPNPAIEQLNISFDFPVKSLISFELFSIDGKLVYSSGPVKLENRNSTESINLKEEEIKPGNYVLRTMVNDKKYFKQVTIVAE